MQTYKLILKGARDQEEEFSCTVPHLDAASTWADELIAELEEEGIIVKDAQLVRA